MEELKFQEILNTKNLVIIHFSHLATMEHEVEFPTDLQHAISLFQEENRSCCALWPKHKMDLPGSVGVIFKPKFDEIISVSSGDSGSFTYGGVEQSAGYPPSEETILASLNVSTGCYNEWRIRGAKPIGIFVSDINNIYAKKKQIFSCGGEIFQEINCTKITIADVCNEFPEMPIFTMNSSGLSPIIASDIEIKK